MSFFGVFATQIFDLLISFSVFVYFSLKTENSENAYLKFDFINRDT